MCALHRKLQSARVPKPARQGRDGPRDVVLKRGGRIRSASPLREGARRRSQAEEEAARRRQQQTAEVQVAALPSELQSGGYLRREWAKFLNDPAKHPLHLASIVGSSGYIMGLAIALTEYLGNAEEIAIMPPIFAGFGIGALYATLLRYANIRIWAAPKKPKTVVITGAARGIGKAMAREFLQAGDRVIITSRSEKAAAQAVKDLREEVGDGCVVYGVSCEVTSQASVARLASMSQSLLGHVDIWINNAAYSGTFKSFTDFSNQQLGEVVRTNLLGSLYCTKAALQIMSSQDGGGHIFNMDGAGADGSPTPNYAAYGCTKSAIGHMMRSIQAEATEAGTGVGVHTCSPGMVLTRLLLDGATIQNKQIFNILCEHPETAAGYLVPRVRSVVALNKRSQYIAYLTVPRIIGKFLTAPLRKGRFFDVHGKPGYLSEYERIIGKGAEDTQRLLEWVRRRDHALVLSYSLTMALTHAAFLYDAIGSSGPVS